MFSGLVKILAQTWHYLTNLQWLEKVQSTCLFCDHTNLKLVYQDELVIAFENIRFAGKHHWLIVPTKHIRDIEALTHEDLPLLHHFEKIKKLLLDKHVPGHDSLVVHTGYHRGRRIMFRNVFWPDIVSIHHLHLHVVVEPRFWLWLFKYPIWLPLMWKSDTQVVQRLEQARKRQV